MIYRTINIEKKRIEITIEVEKVIKEIRKKNIIFYTRVVKYGSTKVKFDDKDIAAKKCHKDIKN